MITTEYAQCGMSLLWRQYLTPQQLCPLAVFIPKRYLTRHRCCGVRCNTHVALGTLSIKLAFGIGILGQMWYLIVSIPDLCTLSYFVNPWYILKIQFHSLGNLREISCFIGIASSRTHWLIFSWSPILIENATVPKRRILCVRENPAFTNYCFLCTFSVILILKAPITTTAEDKFVDILLIFEKNKIRNFMRFVCQQTILIK